MSRFHHFFSLFRFQFVVVYHIHLRGLLYLGIIRSLGSCSFFSVPVSSYFSIVGILRAFPSGFGFGLGVMVKVRAYSHVGTLYFYPRGGGGGLVFSSTEILSTAKVTS